MEEASFGFEAKASYVALAFGTDELVRKGDERDRAIFIAAGVDCATFASHAFTIGDGTFDMRFGLEEGVDADRLRPERCE